MIYLYKIICGMPQIYEGVIDINKNYTSISLFAGIGGICLGLKNAGIETIWANDIDKKASETYRANFPEVEFIEGDIEDVDPKDVPYSDLITFGFPCTSFSIAGYRKGFEDEKTGHLFFEALRIINAKKPRAFILENVKNLVSHDKGKTFNIIQTALKEAGYYLRYKVLNTAEYANIPQNRERIFVIGFKNKEDCDKFYFPDPIALTASMDDFLYRDVKQEERYYYEKTQYYEMLKEAMVNRDTFYQLRRVYVRENKSGLCPTLTANMGTGGHNVPLILDDFGIRKLTPRETLNLQGFPEDFIIPEGMANGHIYKQAGNAVTVKISERLGNQIIKAFEES